MSKVNADLRNYFGRGRARVTIYDGQTAAEGLLETRWQGLWRTWMIRLAQPLGRSRPESQGLADTTAIAEPVRESAGAV